MKCWQSIIKDCQRPGFAKAAIYAKPVGGGTKEGPSARFVEGALRHMGNVTTSMRTVFDDERRRTINVSVTDLETNTTYDVDVSVEKTATSTKMDGREVVSQRTNSNKSTTYVLFPATEDELLMKQNAATSKAKRNLGLNIIPSDIVEDALATCRDTRAQEDAKDPDGERKRLVAAFGALNVGAEALREFLGHELSSMSPKELKELRNAYVAIKDGEASWFDIMQAKGEAKVEAPKQPKANKMDAMKEALKAQKDPTPAVSDEEMAARIDRGET